MSAINPSNISRVFGEAGKITKTDQLDEDKPCNFCGSDAYELTIDGRYGKVVRCKCCGLMYRKTMLGHYPIHFYGGNHHHSQQVEEKQVLQLTDYARSLPIAEKYLRIPRSQKTLLEIGSYQGEFLCLARERGYQVTGLEPNASLAERAKLRYPDMTIQSQFLRDAEFKSDSFDLVCLFHVIEHMNYPLEELNEIYRILKPGGVAVIETPRYDTIWFKLLKERERSVIPEHFYFFTRPSLSAMAKKAGFTVERLDSVGRTLTLDRLLGNVCKVLGSNNIAKLVNRFSKTLHLEQVRFHVNTGDMMRIYASKPVSKT
jgi:SAM-dependent methyltransferase